VPAKVSVGVGGEAPSPVLTENTEVPVEVIRDEAIKKGSVEKEQSELAVAEAARKKANALEHSVEALRAELAKSDRVREQQAMQFETLQSQLASQLSAVADDAKRVSLSFNSSLPAVHQANLIPCSHQIHRLDKIINQLAAELQASRTQHAKAAADSNRLRAEFEDFRNQVVNALSRPQSPQRSAPPSPRQGPQQGPPQGFPGYPGGAYGGAPWNMF